MKLVYLDTSHLSLLSRVRETDSERFGSFLMRWKILGFELAISEASIYEIARLGFNHSRFLLLREFLPIRFEPRIFPKEVMMALRGKGFHDLLDHAHEFCQPIFAESIGAARLQQLCESERNGYNILAQRGHQLSEISWQSKEAYAANKKPGKVRLRDLLDSTTELPHNLDDLLLFLERDGINHPAMRQLRDLRDRADVIGARQAIAEMLGFRSPTAKDLGRSVDESFSSLMFQNSVEFCLSHIVRADTSTIEFLASKVLIEDCPGEFLKERVDTLLQCSGDFETNNQADLRHLSHLPYVDVLTSDKRIVDKVTSVLRNEHARVHVGNVPVPRKASNSIASLEEALFN